MPENRLKDGKQTCVYTRRKRVLGSRNDEVFEYRLQNSLEIPIDELRCLVEGLDVVDLGFEPERDWILARENSSGLKGYGELGGRFFSLKDSFNAEAGKLFRHFLNSHEVSKVKEAKEVVLRIFDETSSEVLWGVLDEPLRDFWKYKKAVIEEMKIEDLDGVKRFSIAFELPDLRPLSGSVEMFSGSIETAGIRYLDCATINYWETFSEGDGVRAEAVGFANLRLYPEKYHGKRVRLRGHYYGSELYDKKGNRVSIGEESTFADVGLLGRGEDVIIDGVFDPKHGGGGDHLGFVERVTL
ncbi:MAG: hypothetical protein AAGB46_13820, partial [Verrucomicrobiota bacterium]